MTPLYGIIGFPLTHSFSAGYFTEKFARESIAATYRNFPLADINMLPALLQQHSNLHGLNVTIPYKQLVIPFLDELSDEATVIGAVNCITVSNGHTKGHNTDVTGFRQSLQPLLQPHHAKALVLGTGGASKAVIYALRAMGISYQLVSRQPGAGVITYDDLTPAIIQDHRLIVNTTPLGTFPAADTFPPIPYHLLTPDHLLYDLVYNPAVTAFLTSGQQQGAVIKNGLEMLHLQAEANWKVWQNQ